MDDADCPNVDDLPACGAHAFSADGRAWTYGGVAFGRSVTFTDTGAAFDFVRRERPHMIFAEGTRTIIGLVNSAEEGKSGNGDRSFTLVQRVRSV